MEFEKSRTWANLMSAFAGESQARTKYENYAQKASEQGYEQIAAIFRATAANELAHASIWLEALHEGALPDTLVNLQDAAQASILSGAACTRTMPKSPGRRAIPVCGGLV